MHLILNNHEPRDWIVSTGETRTVRQLCDYVFSQLGLNYKDFIKQDEKYIRPEELNYLKGDSSEIREKLGWSPTYSFERMIDEMIHNWNSKL